MSDGWMPIPENRVPWLLRLRLWLTSARCTAYAQCGGRVRLIGSLWASRRESAYCPACLSARGLGPPERGRTG